MKRLTYGTFGKILHWGISKPKFQTKLHVILLGIIDETYKETGVDPAHATRWFLCRDDVASTLRETAVTVSVSDVSASFEKEVLPLVNPGKMDQMIFAMCTVIREDNKIVNEASIDSINGLRKADLLASKPIVNIADFLATVFLYVVIHVDNREGVEFAEKKSMEAFFSGLSNLPPPKPPIISPPEPEPHEPKPTESESSKPKSPEPKLPESEPSDDESPSTPLPSRKFPLLGKVAIPLLAVLIVALVVYILRPNGGAEANGSLAHENAHPVGDGSPTPNMDDIIMIAAGYSHSLALLRDRSLWAWGDNTHGQLGDGTMVSRDQPVKILESVKYVAAGGAFSIAILEDNTLWAWGNNFFGQLGDGTNIRRNIPIRVGALENVRYVAVGLAHTLALDNNGVLYAWGYNADGQLGDGTRNVRNTPVEVLADVANISAGQEHSLAIRTDGSLWVWGCNIVGQLGLGSTEPQALPTHLYGLESVASVSGGGYHTLAVTTDGDLWVWGRNTEGQLNGNREGMNQLRPVHVRDNVLHVSAGAAHSLVICTDGNLYAWGSNDAGQIGRDVIGVQGINEPILSAVESPFHKIAAGMNMRNGHSLALDENGNLWAWGNHRYRQHDYNEGQAVQIQISNPATYQEITINVQTPQIATGCSHTLIVIDGVLWAWGNNAYGQLGDGTYIDRHSPVKIMESVVYVAAGYASSFAIQADGSLWAWGSNIYGRLGDGAFVAQRNIPVRIMESAVAVSAGSFHTLALDANGHVWAWGNNGRVILGISEDENNRTPSKVQGLENIVQISAGLEHSMAIDRNNNLWIWGHSYWGNVTEYHTPRIMRESVSYVATGYNIIYHMMIIQTDGSLWGIGDNYYGQLGDGTTEDRYDFVRIGTSYDWRSVSVGDFHTAAIEARAGGERVLHIWGNNAYGQLGDGTHTDRHSPIRVDEVNPVLSVSAGGNHTIAIDPNGNVWEWGYKIMEIPPSPRSHWLEIDEDSVLWGWGNNEFGQLARPDPEENGPVAIMDSVAAVAVGELHSLALGLDGTLFSWGNNWFGQLGDGTRSRRLNTHEYEVIEIIGAVRHISAGDYHSLALCENNTLWTWGRNDWGQLGDGTTTMNPTPTPVAQNIAYARAGENYTMAIGLNNEIHIWGRDSQAENFGGNLRLSPINVRFE